MSHRYPGGVLSSTAPVTTNASAKGIWTEQSLLQNVATGNWPRSAGAPTIGTATAGSQSATVTFTPPTDVGTGTPLTYTVTSSPGSITATGSSSPITVTGLTNGTAYTFTVTASTPGGTSPASAASNSVTPVAPVYIEDTFSTYLYTGNSASRSITNNVALSTNGGMVWIKSRNNATSNALFDTARGVNKYLSSNSTGPQDQYGSFTNMLTAFNADGFSLGTDASTAWVNNTGYTYSSWTFRKQPKFFDVVTYTGNGAARTISHSLGSVPACIIVKQTNAAGEDWAVYHRSLPLVAGSLNDNFLTLNTTSAYSTSTDIWNRTVPTSTVFSVGNHPSTNSNGASYVAYLFAHNAGGFGLNSTDNVITCDSFTADVNGDATVTLGYEPQWVLVKRTDAAPVRSWVIIDTMRAWTNSSVSQTLTLQPNTNDAEAFGTIGADNLGYPTATGFKFQGVAEGAYIYIAIRKGPMKTPTDATKVFTPITYTGTGATRTITSVAFPFDFYLAKGRDVATNQYVLDRLRGFQTYNGTATTPFLLVNSTNGDGSTTTAISSISSDGSFSLNGNNTSINGSGSNFVSYQLLRAPGFFDIVCYTGTSTGINRDINHNLGVLPEFAFIKSRSGASSWQVVVPAPTTGNFYVGLQASPLALNSSNGNGGEPSYPWSSYATSTTFNTGLWWNGNDTGTNYVAYLFASCPGVSKVGTYTGTAGTQTINCGFTGGARFVLIKRTDTTGSWYYWDTARGMVSGSDYYILLNTSNVEVSSPWLYTTTGGFQIVTSDSRINANGGTYSFLAIA